MADTPKCSYCRSAVTEPARNAATTTQGWFQRQEDIVYGFIKEPYLLRQYCELYRKECRMVDARIGSKCIGGGRLSVRSAGQTKPLPIEIADFRLENCFAGLKQPGVRYGEISRLVLLPEFRDAAAPLVNLRAYRKHCRSIGVRAEIHTDVDLPPYPGFEQVKDYLFSCEVPKMAAGRAERQGARTAMYQTVMMNTPQKEYFHANE